jgi:hypothetical protein
MIRSVMWVTVGVSLSVLAGCGSSDGANAPTLREQFLATVAEGDAISDRYQPPRLATTPLNMPDTGQVTYNGASGVIVETPTSITLLAGDARVVADFATNTLSGNMSNFIGVTGPNTDDPSEEVLDSATAYTGELSVTNGVIGSIVASGVAADFGGTLTGQGNVIVIDGTMIGQFFGNPNPVGLLMNSNEATTTTTLNGVAVTGTAGISAER